jgi:hypothetical protein
LTAIRLIATLFPIMTEILNPPNSPAAEESQPPADMVTSEEFITRLRALMALVPDVPALTPKKRRMLQRLGRVSESEAQAAINVVQASDKVASTVEETAEVQEMLEAANRWTAAESELKAAWRKVADANLVRWNRIANFAALTYGSVQSWRSIRRMTNLCRICGRFGA